MKVLKKREVASTFFLALAVLTASAQKVEAPKISGLVNVRYSWNDADQDTHGFDVRRIRLAATGRLNDKLDYKFQAEYETSVKVIDAFLRYKISPEIGIQIGQFKVPYSQETLYGPATWLVQDNPAVVSKLNGYNDLSGLKSNGRDVGFILYGGFLHQESGFDVIRYKTGVFNGNGINVKDNNKRKDYAALLYISPVKSLSLTAGYYDGAYRTKGDVEDIKRQRTSAGFEWKDDKLTVRSEYIHGTTGNQKSDGVYAQVAYFVSPKVQPLVSYDFFEADTELRRTQNNYQIAVNILPVKHLRIQAGWTYTHYNSGESVSAASAQFLVDF